MMLLFDLLLKHFLAQKKPDTIIKNGTAWFEKHLIIIVATGLNDNRLLKCINTTNSAHSNLDKSISGIYVLFGVFVKFFSPFNIFPESSKRHVLKYFSLIVLHIGLTSG